MKNTIDATRRGLLLAALAGLAAPVARAQGQAPAGMTSAPVRIGSTLPVGSGPDVVSRMIAEKLQVRWGRPVIVDPKPGGAGMVAINAVKGQPPTGNDLVVADVGNLSINPLIFRNLSYDPERDLVPVAMLYRTVFFVVVGADGPYRTLKDLLAAAGRPGGALKYGSNAVGGPIHLGSARLESALGAEMLHVPFKETSQLYASVAAGEVDWALGSLATTRPLAQAGKLRLLAVADAARSPARPDVPTIEEAGGPKGIAALSWVALMAPRGTPEATVADINRGVNEALAQPDVRQKLADFGFVPAPGPAQQVAEAMRADRALYAEVLKRVKVTVD